MGNINISDNDKNNNQINVNIGGSASSVNLTDNLSQFYANKAKKWAISPELVENEDYSAKYYANNAKNEASAAKILIEQGLYDINNANSNTLNNIQNNKNAAIEEIQTEGAAQIANIKSTGFYMQDGKLYYIENGQAKEFNSGSQTVFKDWRV